jgi:hypothetical protein
MTAERGEAPGQVARAASISFAATRDQPGLELFDPVERHQYVLHADREVTPTSASPEGFRFPVTDAVEITASAVEFDSVVGVYVRDDAGDLRAEAEHFADVELPAGAYSVELTTPIKTYLRVESAVAVSADFEGTRIEFGEPTRVVVGARSRHQRPAATVTTTRDPRDVMAAVSTFGSALKTTSPERSFPTLRGHPPRVELGDELHVPDGVESPDTGVRVELPATYRAVYVAAPLAYYLGADVVPGDEPRVVTEDAVHALDGPDGFEHAVERVLKQTFLLDCVTRTEGHYDVDLHERDAIEPLVDLDFAALYDASLSARLDAYLDVPYDVVADHVPEWKLTTHVAPTADSAELLPFLVDDLAVVRSPRAREAGGSDAQLAAVNDFLRDDDFTRSASGASGGGPATLRPEETDSLEQAWFGDGAPVGASKPTVEAFRNRLDRTPADGDIDITVVCNDPEMDEERSVVDDVYGSRDELPFDVAVHRELSRADLRGLLAADCDFLHYIGHINDEGFQCADGKLDAATLDTVGVDAFFLNACQSYHQGLSLIEAGGIGGVVTLRDVINSGAVTLGRTLARLLNRGFPLRAALNIAGEETVIGSQYIVVGDGGHAIAQPESGTPYICTLDTEGDALELAFTTYPTNDRGMGTVVAPQVPHNEGYYLSSGEVEPFTVSQSSVLEYFQATPAPVLIDGELTWTSDVEEDDLF